MTYSDIVVLLKRLQRKRPEHHPATDKQAHLPTVEEVNAEVLAYEEALRGGHQQILSRPRGGKGGLQFSASPEDGAGPTRGDPLRAVDDEVLALGACFACGRGDRK